jgi:sulfate adenylyltransferase
MGSYKTCPYESEPRGTLSGTAVRQILESSQMPPWEPTRPEVAEILCEAYAARARAGT